MSKKICEQCGKKFEAFNPEFTKCPKCTKGVNNNVNTRRNYDMNNNKKGSYQSSSTMKNKFLGKELLLDTFYDGSNLRREVFCDVPKNIATIFENNSVKSTSIRRFYNVVRLAYEKCIQNPEQNFGKSREMIWSLDHLSQYCESRGVTNNVFTRFIKHYIQLAQSNPENLKGFKMLFQSIIGYLPKN